MSIGELLTRTTVWVALGGYALGAASLLLARLHPQWLARARLSWTVGCLAFLAHVICAFTYYHDWSHEAAYQETASQTGRVIGWSWGGGLFVSYAFTLAWAADTLWWWLRGLASYERRPRPLVVAWHAFFFFIVFNGTVVFETGPVRVFGLIICVGLALLSLVTVGQDKRRAAD